MKHGGIGAYLYLVFVQVRDNARRTPAAYWVSSCSVAQSCPILWDPMDCSTPGFPVLHHLPESAQTHVLWVSDAILPSNPLSPPSLPALNRSQHQGLFQWVGSSHQVAKVLELQHQSFQWMDWFDLLAVQGTLKSSPAPQFVSYLDRVQFLQFTSRLAVSDGSQLWNCPKI